MRTVLLLSLASCGSRLSIDTFDSGDSDADTDADTDTDTDTDTDADTDADSDADTDITPWRHTATVDGSTSDYGPDETFAASSGATVRLTWDDAALYVAVEHPDVAAGGPQHWVLVYVGNGAGGSAAGVPFGSQQPALPTPMSHLVRWKADGSYDSLEAWDGSAWASTSAWLGTGGSAVAESGAVVEMALPFDALGVTGAFDVHVAMLYEGSGSESTWGGVPAGSFADGFDPDFTRWYRFDRAGAAAPGGYLPSP